MVPINPSQQIFRNLFPKHTLFLKLKNSVLFCHEINQRKKNVSPNILSLTAEIAARSTQNQKMSLLNVGAVNWNRYVFNKQISTQADHQADPIAIRNRILQKFTPKKCFQAFRENRQEEWTHEFLNTVGGNKDLSNGLKRKKRYWSIPHKIPLSWLQRVAGPEWNMQYKIPKEDWAQRITSLQKDILKKWSPPPLICEYEENGLLNVRDGNHRVEALKLAGVKDYWVIIWFNDYENYQNYCKSTNLPISKYENPEILHMKIVKLFKETNEIQRVIALRNSRNNRHRYQEFIVEGRVAIDEAYKQGWKIKALFYNKDFSLSDWAKKLLIQGQYEVAYELPEALMNKIADKTESTEMLGIAAMQIRSFTEYQAIPNDVVVVIDSSKSAGNMGMMIRSAVAFGVNAIVLSGHSADEYDPKCIRASVGTFFSIPIYRVEGVDKFLDKLEQIKSNHQLTLIASGDEGAVSLKEINFDEGILFLVLGNETRGISSGFKQVANQFVRIDLPAQFTSLNVAAAGSIFLYEIFRQRKK